MAPTITEFLGLTKAKKNTCSKAELISLLESVDPNVGCNGDIKTLISSITELTSDIWDQ